jgi:hypothetical protein
VKLRITTPNAYGGLQSGSAASLYLDDVDVSRYVARVVVVVDAEDVLRAQVTFALSEVEIDIPATIEPLIEEAREKTALLGHHSVKVLTA